MCILREITMNQTTKYFRLCHFNRKSLRKGSFTNVQILVGFLVPAVLVWLCVQVFCSELQWVAVSCSVLQRQKHCNTLQHTEMHDTHLAHQQHTATHCTTLQHTETHCTTLQHTAPHCTTLHHTAPHCNTLKCMKRFIHISAQCILCMRVYVCVCVCVHVCVCVLVNVYARATTNWKEKNLLLPSTAADARRVP